MSDLYTRIGGKRYPLSVANKAKLVRELTTPQLDAVIRYGWTGVSNLRQAAYAVLMLGKDLDKVVLVQKPSRHGSDLHAPGGAVDAVDGTGTIGDSPTACIVRELHEELGLQEGQHYWFDGSQPYRYLCEYRDGSTWLEHYFWVHTEYQTAGEILRQMKPEEGLYPRVLTFSQLRNMKRLRDTTADIVLAELAYSMVSWGQTIPAARRQ